MQITVMAKNIIIHKIRTTTPTNPNNDRNRDGNLNTGLEKWYTYVIIVFVHWTYKFKKTKLIWTIYAILIITAVWLQIWQTAPVV